MTKKLLIADVVGNEQNNENPLRLYFKVDMANFKYGRISLRINVKQ